MKNKEITFKKFDDIKDKFIGMPGTSKREQYEIDLKLDLLGHKIKEIRRKRNLTQARLGELTGVRKSEISKLENNKRNMTIGTVLKIFNALEADIKFQIYVK